MSDFKVLPLPEVLEFREGPGVLAVDFHDSGVPLIRIAGLKQGAALLTGCNFLEPSKVAQKWSQFRLRAGDVLLSTSASLGEVASVDDSAVGAIPYTGIIAFRPLDERVIPEFIPLMLTERSFKLQIEAMGVGSVMKHFGPSHLRKMTVTVPPLEEQRSISSLLGTIDRKIAANSKLVAALDELAHTFFVSHGEGSRLLPLSDTAQFVNGKAFTKGASGTGRVVVRIAELRSGLGASTVYSDAEVADKHVARPGDILFAWSGSLTLKRWFRQEAIINQHIFKVIPEAGYPAWLLFQLVSAKMDAFKAIAADKATTMGHIQRHHLDQLVSVPSGAAIESMESAMNPLWSSALLAEQESLKLMELRNTLLPELMSGRLRVKDAEKKIEEVV